MFNYNWFIISPTEANLRKREHETEESIDKRLGRARGEIAYGMETGNFDAVIVFKDADQAFEDALNMISGWYPAFHFDEEDNDTKES